MTIFARAAFSTIHLADMGHFSSFCTMLLEKPLHFVGAHSKMGGQLASGKSLVCSSSDLAAV
jgi:hypothetical protein